MFSLSSRTVRFLSQCSLPLEAPAQFRSHCEVFAAVHAYPLRFAFLSCMQHRGFFLLMLIALDS